MVYDIFAKYRAHRSNVLDNASLALHRPSIGRELRLIPAFVIGDPLSVAHHIAVVLYFLPQLLNHYGHGHFLIGCFLCFELSTPFVHLRSILSLLGYKQSKLYVLNGYTMVATFFLCRVLLPPGMYVWFARNQGTRLLALVRAMPWRCHVSMLALYGLQMFWFRKMIKGILTYLNNGD